MSRQVFPTAPSPTTTHLGREMGLASDEEEQEEGGGLGKEEGRGGNQ